MREARWFLVALLAACPSTNARLPAPDDVFDPKPNHHFHATSGEVRVVGLDGHVVCFTTDGSDPREEGGACAGDTAQQLDETKRIALGCGDDRSADSLHVIKLAFEWAGQHGVTVAGNFVLDCTAPPPDRDGDGVDDDHDNCPVTSNTDQLDADGDGIGDACENLGEPDADCDGRPDTTDNCLSVWNVTQADDDRDGVGNPCDATSRPPPPLPWNNGTLARAFAKWFDEVRCTLNSCQNPTGLGSWNATCDGGGTVAWSITANGLRGNSVFTYSGCQRAVTVDVRDWTSTDPAATTPMTITLVVSGPSPRTRTSAAMVARAAPSPSAAASPARSPHTCWTTRCAAPARPTRRPAPRGRFPRRCARRTTPRWRTCSPTGRASPALALRRPPRSPTATVTACSTPTTTAPSSPTPIRPTSTSTPTATRVTRRPGPAPACPTQACRRSTRAPGSSGDGGISFYALKVKLGRCLYDDAAGNVRSAGTCNAASVDQQWELLEVGGQRSFRNKKTQQCLLSNTWAGAIVMGACGGTNAGWLTQRYDQGGFDPKYPLRFRSGTYNYCLYTDHTGLVYATQGNCDLLGTQDNRKLGIFANGDFSATPLQP